MTEKQGLILYIFWGLLHYSFNNMLMLRYLVCHTGGSDVANGTETVAIKQNDGSYNLHGYKWFSSATDADISLTLARIVDEDGRAKEVTQYKEICIANKKHPFESYGLLFVSEATFKIVGNF